MTNSVKRASVALALVSGLGALTGCQTFEGVRADVGGLLPTSRATAPVQSTVGSAVPTPPGTYTDKRGYVRFNDGPIVGAPTGSCSVMRQAANEANRPDRTSQQTGNQVGAAAQRGVQGGGAALANGVAYGNTARGVQAAGAVVGSSIAAGAGAIVGGLFRGGANESAQDAAKARYQMAYNNCSQEFAAQVDAQCAIGPAADRNSAAYVQCFDRRIANSPAPVLVPNPSR